MTAANSGVGVSLAGSVTSLVICRMAMPPVVAVLQSVWDDPSSDANPLLAPCRRHVSCTCRPMVVATRQELHGIAAAKNVPVDAEGRPTDEGFELLAEYLFGPDLDVVQVADPLDPRTRQLFDSWRRHREADRLAARQQHADVTAIADTSTSFDGDKAPHESAIPATQQVAEPGSATSATLGDGGQSCSPSGATDIGATATSEEPVARWRHAHHRASVTDLGPTATPAVRATAVAVVAVVAPVLIVWFSTIAAAICWISIGVWVVRMGARMREETMGYRALRQLAHATVIVGLLGIASGIFAGLVAIIS